MEDFDGAPSVLSNAFPGLELVTPAGDLCGEGAVWSRPESAVYWTDINGFRFHRYCERDGTSETLVFDEPVVALGLTGTPGELIVALGSELVLWRRKEGVVRTLFRLPSAPEFRLNDGRPGPDGAFWIGSMRNNVGPTGEHLDVPFADGHLYRVQPDGRYTSALEGLGIPNTVVWSADGSHFYFGDSAANLIWSISFSADGTLGERTTLLRDFDRGVPDGSAIDRDGYLWNCRFGGRCIVRISPEGNVDRLIELPFSNPTTCTFGGEDLRTLYITSARVAAGPNDVNAGGLFKMRVETPGLPERLFQPI